jgi:hypothetical protein
VSWARRALPVSRPPLLPPAVSPPLPRGGGLTAPAGAARLVSEAGERAAALCRFVLPGVLSVLLFSRSLLLVCVFCVSFSLCLSLIQGGGGFAAPLCCAPPSSPMSRVGPCVLSSVHVLCACAATLCFAFSCSPAAFVCCVIPCSPVVSCVLSGVLLRLSPRRAWALPLEVAHSWCHLCLFFCVWAGSSMRLRTPPTAAFDVRCRLVLSLAARCRVATRANAARAMHNCSRAMARLRSRTKSARMR